MFLNNGIRIEYQKILDEIRFYLRGEAFDENVFLDRLKMIDNFVTDRCKHETRKVKRVPGIKSKVELRDCVRSFPRVITQRRRRLLRE